MKQWWTVKNVEQSFQNESGIIYEKKAFESFNIFPPKKITSRLELVTLWSRTWYSNQLSGPVFFFPALD